MSEIVNCLIIGSGPAGFTAAIYAARANLSPVLYEGVLPGGQLTTTAEIENFPGYPDGVSGSDMMEDLRKQAARFGTDIRFGIVTEADLKGDLKRVVVDGEKEVLAKTVIIATGASARYLGLPDEAKYAGEGVSACATCDGFFYRKKTVAVVGGGDTACADALILPGFAKRCIWLLESLSSELLRLCRRERLITKTSKCCLSMRWWGLTAITEWLGLRCLLGADSRTRLPDISILTGCSSLSGISLTPRCLPDKLTLMPKDI